MREFPARLTFGGTFGNATMPVVNLMNADLQ